MFEIGRNENEVPESKNTWRFLTKHFDFFKLLTARFILGNIFSLKGVTMKKVFGDVPAPYLVGFFAKSSGLM